MDKTTEENWQLLQMTGNNNNNGKLDKEDMVEEGGQAEEENTLLYQMEHKYFCEDKSDRKCENNKEEEAQAYFIDIFGHSPCRAAHERLLELLVLDNLGICRIGCVNRLASLAKRVAELDLSGNRLDWLCVGQLLLALPQLRTLNLSHNPELSKCLTKQQQPDSEGQQRLPTAPKLGTLILNGISMSMPTLRTIVQSAPSLRELHLSRANFCDLPNAHSNDGQAFEPISSILDELHLNECGLDDWCQVMTILQFFPFLESLFLAHNPLPTVQRECPQCCAISSSTNNTANDIQFGKRIRMLSLSNTKIGSWEAIENLEAMQQLEDLRVAHIPLLENYSPEERRHLVVGRLRSLKVLNGSTIDARQREESERFFIRYYALMEKKPLIYDQLVAKHGMLEQLVKVDLTPKRFAKVSIHCDETDWIRMWVRIRLSGTVHQLMKFAERVTNIQMRLMRIFYVDMCTCGMLGPTELRFPNQQLKMLHIEDGDEFFVQSKPMMASSNNNGTSSQSPTKQRTAAVITNSGGGRQQKQLDREEDNNNKTVV